MKSYPEDFPWGEFLKACIPFIVVLILFFTCMLAISAESIAWMFSGDRNVAAPTEERSGDRNVAAPTGVTAARGGDIPVADGEVAK